MIELSKFMVAISQVMYDHFIVARFSLELVIISLFKALVIELDKVCLQDY